MLYFCYTFACPRLADTLATCRSVFLLLWASYTGLAARRSNSMYHPGDRRALGLSGHISSVFLLFFPGRLHVARGILSRIRILLDFRGLQQRPGSSPAA